MLFYSQAPDVIPLYSFFWSERRILTIPTSTCSLTHLISLTMPTTTCVICIGKWRCILQFRMERVVLCCHGWQWKHCSLAYLVKSQHPSKGHEVHCVCFLPMRHHLYFWWHECVRSGMFGLNVEGFGNEYDTALGMARQGGYDTIVDLLEGLGAPDKSDALE